MSDIVIYTRDFCGFCVAAKKLLKKKGLAIEEINASYDSALRAEMVARSGGGSTFPQIFIGDFHVGGCDDLFALEKSGKLDQLTEGQKAKQ